VKSHPYSWGGESKGDDSMKKALIGMMTGLAACILIGCINSPRFGDIYAVNPSIQTGSGNVATVASQGTGVSSEFKSRYTAPIAEAGTAVAATDKGVPVTATGKVVVNTGGGISSTKTIDAATEMELVKQLRGANAGTGSSQQTGNPQDNDTPSIDLSVPVAGASGAAASTAGSAVGGLIEAGKKLLEGKKDDTGTVTVAGWVCPKCGTANDKSAEVCAKPGCGEVCPTCKPVTQ